MNMKRTLVLFLTLVMLVSAFGPTLNVFAEAWHNHSEGGDTKTTINYVSLGDSMTNGIGFEEENGYDKTEHEGTTEKGTNGYREVASDAYPAQFAAWLAGYTGEIKGGQTQYVGDKGTVNLTQLATSGARVEDIYYILNHGTPNAVKPDAWTINEMLENGDRWGDPHEYEKGNYSNTPVDHDKYNNAVAHTFQKAIEDADVVSLASGNGNFGVFLVGRIMNLVGFGSEVDKKDDEERYGHYTLENALTDFEVDEDLAKIIRNAYAAAMEYAEAMNLPMALVERVANLTAYTTASYLVHTMKLIDLIVEMNPDVTFMIVPLINNGQGFTLEVDGKTHDMGDFLAELYNPINDFLAIYPTVQQYKGNYEKATFLYASLPEKNGEEVKVETFAEAFKNLYADIEDTNEDGAISEDEYPANRLFCHNRFRKEIQSFVMPILLDGEVNDKYEDTFDEYDVQAYEIAEANGTAAFAAYAAEKNATQLQLIAQYLGIVDAVLYAMGSTPVVDSSEITMPEGEFNMFDLLGPVVGELTIELPVKVQENATAISQSIYVDLVEAMVVPKVVSHLENPDFIGLFGLNDETLKTDLDKTLYLINLALNNDAKFEYTPAGTKELLVGAHNEVSAGVPDLAKLTVLPGTLSEGLGSVGLLNALLALYGRMKLASGLSSHPSQAGHDTLTESLQIGYTEGVLEAEGKKGMPASLVLEKFYNLYLTVEGYGLLGDIPELEVVKEIYEILDAEKLITDEQTLDIVLYTYVRVEDKTLSDEEVTEIGKHVYAELVNNPLIEPAKRVAVVGNVYFILKSNDYLNEVAATKVVEEIYTALDAENLITDAQSLAIVHCVYEAIVDGDLSNEDIFNIVKFIYNTLVKDDNTSGHKTRKRAPSSQDDADAAKTLRIVLGVLSENYLDEENKKSVEKLITGDDALINDALLIKLVDNALADVENNQNEDMDTLVELVSTNAIQIVLDDPNTDDATKFAIAGEIKDVANSNGLVDNETNDVIDEVLDLVGAIYENLVEAELMGEAEKDKIVAQLIKVASDVVSGKELSDDDIIAIVLNVADIIFGREDLTLEQKVQILVVVYNTLDEEGYITEENLMFIAGLVAEYYDEAYAYAYQYADTHGYIDVSVEAIDEAIKAIYLAIDEVEAGLLGVTDELKAEIIKELYAIIPTLREIQNVLASDSAKDVEGLVAAVFELEDDLYTHLANIYAILEQAAIDVNQLVLAPAFKEAMHYINTVVIPEIIETASVIADKVVEYVQEKLSEYYSILLGISEEVYNKIVETLVRIQLHVQGKLEPIINTYFELIEILKEIYGTVEEAVRVASEIIFTIIDTFNYLDEKLDGALSDLLAQMGDSFWNLVKTIYNACGDIEGAIMKALCIIANIADTIDGTIDAVIDAYNALVNKLYEIYGDIETALAKAYEIYNDILAKANGLVADAIKLYNEILDILVDVYGTVENVVIVAGQIFSYVIDFFGENLTAEQLKTMFDEIVAIVVESYGTSKDVYYVASQVYAYLLNAMEHAFEGNYVVTDDSMYVSLGNAVYGKELANMLTLRDKYYNFDLTGKYINKVAQADLITIRLDNGEAIAFVLGQLENPGVLDWNKYLDAEGQKALNEILADVKAELLANGKAQELADKASGAVAIPGMAISAEGIADIIVYAIECAIYSYAEFIDRMTVVLENVYAAAPNATVVLTGIQNPLEDLDLSAFGLDIDLGEYSKAVDVVVAGLNLNLVAAALVNENTIFVDSNNAKDIYDALNVQFALTTCNHVYDDCEDTTCNLCGEVRVAPGHSFTNYVYNNDATCGKNGTETAKCDNCDAVDTREAQGTALEHVWADATCTAPKTCTLCGETEGDMLPHTWGEWKVLREPTHKVKGFREHKCLVCGRLEAEAMDKLPGLSTGAIIAICVGGVVVLAGIGLGTYFLVKKKKATSGKKADAKKSK